MFFRSGHYALTYKPFSSTPIINTLPYLPVTHSSLLLQQLLRLQTGLHSLTMQTALVSSYRF